MSSFSSFYSSSPHETSDIFSQLASRSDHVLPQEYNPNQPRWSSHADYEYRPTSSSQSPKSLSGISFDDTAPSGNEMYPTSFGKPNQGIEIAQPRPQRFHPSIQSIETFCTSTPESRMSENPDSYVGEKKDIHWLESTSPNDQSEPAPPPYSASVDQTTFYSQQYYPDEKVYSHYDESSESVASHMSRWSASKQTFYKKAKSIISRFSSAITGRRDSRLNYDKSFDSDSGSPYEFSYTDMYEKGRFTGEWRASTGMTNGRGPEFVW
ncbi:hypothetical protein V865_005676 [Kwoniella europaea PYCC6329]|uniref:Uncharacterized protein n=1 Tax=Kwoniella europaea PYCC6329 TaxID=1423913 RepID=A0AAX4KPQ2_9TREE